MDLRKYSKCKNALEKQWLANFNPIKHLPTIPQATHKNANLSLVECVGSIATTLTLYERSSEVLKEIWKDIKVKVGATQ